MTNWKSDLNNFYQNKEKEKKIREEKLTDLKPKVATFYLDVVVPAFKELKEELEKHQRKITVSTGLDYASILVEYNGETELSYSIKVKISPNVAFPYPETRFTDPTNGKHYKAEGFFRSGEQNYDVTQITKDEIINHFLSDYKTSVRSK